MVSLGVSAWRISWGYGSCLLGHCAHRPQAPKAIPAGTINYVCVDRDVPSHGGKCNLSRDPKGHRAHRPHFPQTGHRTDGLGDGESGLFHPQGTNAPCQSTLPLGGIGRALFYRSAWQQSIKGATCLGLSFCGNVRKWPMVSLGIKTPILLAPPGTHATTQPPRKTVPKMHGTPLVSPGVNRPRIPPPLPKPIKPIENPGKQAIFAGIVEC